MKKTTLSLLVVALGAIPLMAATPAKPPKASTPIVPDTNQVEYQENLITSITSKFMVVHREMDPFGLTPRGSTVKALIQTKQKADAVQVEIIDVAAAVRHMTMQAIDEQHHMAIDGESGRDILEGDLLVLNYKGQQFKVWVNTIRPDEIDFTEYQTGVKSSLHLDFVEQDPNIIDDTPSSLDKVPGVSKD